MDISDPIAFSFFWYGTILLLHILQTRGEYLKGQTYALFWVSNLEHFTSKGSILQYNPLRIIQIPNDYYVKHKVADFV